ncbi:MAG: hypothetical protein ABIG93_03620 [archaeon]|nr:hypothetical protein [Nanoarchaeota archaeon]
MKLEQEDLGKWIAVTFNPQKLSDEDVESQRIPYSSVIDYELREKDEEFERFFEQIPTAGIAMPVVDSVNPYYVGKHLGASRGIIRGKLEEITDTYFKLK